MGISVQARAALDAARAITAKADAEGRELSAAEVEAASNHLKEFNRLKTATIGADEVKSALAGLGMNLGDGATPAPPAQSAGFKARAKAAWAQQAGERLKAAMRGAQGQKALISGTVDVPSVIGSPVEMVGRPTSVLDLVLRPPVPNAAPPLGSERENQGNGFQYLRQTTRTNNAGPVADNATKPTSVYTFGEVEDTFRVYAHLSEVLPLRYLTDFNGLVQIIRDQLGEGLMEALEEDVLTGAVQPQDGFTGILNTSGIQSQAWTTDLLTTLSNARYKLENSNQTPTAWVLNPNDLQKLELLREDGATGAFMFRNGRADIEKFLGDYPIVTSTLMTEGIGLLGDWNQTELLIKEDDHIDIDTGGVLFEKNQFRLRIEGRYGFKIGRPLAFVQADLTV